MKDNKVTQAYEIAKERYAQLGVDVEKVLTTLERIPLSIHCWQTDDVSGFENPDGQLTGGIQTTGNYPGKARNIDEVRQDLEEALSHIPGNHRLSLHAIYGDFGGKFVDRNEIEPKHFESWMQWAKENNMKLDFNSTSFSHPKSGELSLSNPDDSIREFWIEHTKRSREIANAMGEYQNDPCIMNLWIHDGMKDETVNRLKYRQLLKESLDEIYKTPYKHMVDCLESKLFGIGAESYTVGSHDFYLAYGVKNDKVVTLDIGHFNTAENVADKISSLLLFTKEIMLHVTRPVRWDSDHVVTINDSTLDLMKEITRADALNKVHIGLDFFDASINRIGAYVVGSRSTQKCLLQALLEPIERLRKYEANGQYFERLALLEEAKTMPWGAVWDMFCLRNDVAIGDSFISEVQKYEKNVSLKR
ncbi:MAG: L-rhamnose isomerase [Bacteroides sp.]|nr:L-rhamnose isomerase [Bacteroides sp.]